MSEKNKKFVRGAAMLGLAGIVVKIIGAGFRIPLANMIDAVGMSYYQAAYPIYNWLLIISTAGIPIAIAKLISEKEAVEDHMGVDRIKKTSFKLLMAIGLATSILLMIFSKQISGLVGNDEAVYSMMAIAPALFFVSVLSVYRGYFNGIQKMGAYAISQVIEQIFRVLVGLSLAYVLFDGTSKMTIEASSPFAAAGATFGATVGGLAGTIYMVWCYRKHRKQQGELLEDERFIPEKTSMIIEKLFKIAIPVSIGASILPMMSMIDLAIVMNRLQLIGYTEIESKALYGQLSGFAMTVINLPMIVTAALQVSLVPALSQSIILKRKEEANNTIEMGIRLGMTIALPCTLGIIFMAKPIMLTLYPTKIDSALSAASILEVLGWGVLGLSMFQVFSGVLQGLGKVWLPARNLGIAVVSKVVLTYTLVGIPELNIKGVAIATSFAYCFAAILNYISIVMVNGSKNNLKMILLKPLLASCVMVVVAVGGYHGGMLLINGNGMGVDSGKMALIINGLVTLGSIGLAGFVYLAVLIKIKGLDDEDYDLLPGGGKLKKLANVIQRKG